MEIKGGLTDKAQRDQKLVKRAIETGDRKEKSHQLRGYKFNPPKSENPERFYSFRAI